MMHTQLLNIGFVKMPDGTYYNYEIGLTVSLNASAQTVSVDLPTGTHTATIAELEEAIISGGFGEF